MVVVVIVRANGGESSDQRRQVGLDRRRCWQVIDHLRALGTTIVLTTHYLDEAEHLAERIAILQDGRIRACGTAAELAGQAGAEPRMELVQPSLEEVYLQLVGTTQGMSQ